MDMLNRLCKALDCQPGDLFEYIPDVELSPTDGVGKPHENK